MKPKTLQAWGFKRNLLSVPGVANIVSSGREVKTYEITVNPSQLASYGITPLDVYDAVSKRNINVEGDNTLLCP